MPKVHQKGSKIRPKHYSRTKRLLSTLNPANADILGKELQFKYSNSSERFQTIPGGLLSILVLLCTLFIAISAVLNFIDKTSPSVSILTKYVFDPPDFDLHDQDLLPPLTLSLPGRLIPTSEVSSYITIKLSVLLFTVDAVSGLPTYMEEVVVDYVPCKTVRDRKLVDAIKEGNPVSFGLLEEFGLCPDTKIMDSRIKASGRFERTPFRSVMLQVLPCSLPDVSLCRPASQLKGLTVSHVLVRRVFDGSNYKNPIAFLPEFDANIGIDTRSTKNSYYKLRKNEIWDSELDFFGDKLKTKFDDYFLFGTDFRQRDVGQVYCDHQRLALCEPYLVVSYQATGETKVVTRTYNKLFETLGEIGGAREIVMILAALLYAYYNEKRLEASLRRDVLGGRELESVSKYFEGDKKLNAVDEGHRTRLVQGDRPNTPKYSQGESKTADDNFCRFWDNVEDLENKIEVLEPRDDQHDPKPQLTPLESINHIKFSRQQQGYKISENGGKESENTAQEQSINNNQMRSSVKGLRFGKTPKIGKNPSIEDSLKELVSERLDTHQNGLNLYRKMDVMDVIDAMLFEPHDHVLLPLVLLNIKKKEKEEKERGRASGKKILAYGIAHAKDRMTTDQAYQSLVKHQPLTQLGATVKQFMLQNLPKGFNRVSKCLNDSQNKIDGPVGSPEKARKMIAEDFKKGGGVGNFGENVHDDHSKGSQGHSKNLIDAQNQLFGNSGGSQRRFSQASATKWKGTAPKFKVLPKRAQDQASVSMRSNQNEPSNSHPISKGGGSKMVFTRGIANKT